MAMKKQFTATELAEALKNKTLGKRTVVYACVKQGDVSNQVQICTHLQFEFWIPVPLDVIMTAEYIQDYVGPEGHSYPLFALALDSGNQLAALLAELVNGQAQCLGPSDFAVGNL
jgi:hypothetical protein